MVLNTKRHTRVGFDEDLEQVLELTRQMGELVERQLKEAISLFSMQDKKLVPELAEKIIANDRKVNDLEIQITNHCLFIIQKHIPQANDLRLVFSLLRASSEFERIGDTVTNICDIASHSEHVINTLIERIEHFSEETRALLHESLHALINMDIAYATETYMNDRYRKDYRDIYRQVVNESKNDIEHLDEYFRAVVALRQIQRIGDRCRNINEFVFFYNKGHVANWKDFAELYKEYHPEQ